jgi:transposase
MMIIANCCYTGKIIMINIAFTEKNISELQILQTSHPHHVVRRRALMLILKNQDIPHNKIAKITDVCENTVRHCFDDYLQGGIDKIKTMNFYQPESRLNPFETIVREYFDKTPPCTISQACVDIEKLTGIFIKNTQMRSYIKSLGIKHRKVNSIPAKADIEAQEKFYDQELQPRLEEAKTGTRKVYFVDAAHFVLGAFLGYLWSFVRVFVRTPSGRQRFNVLGALDAITKELITITNNTYITSLQVCELLRKIAKNASVPISLVLDNARYQRCHLVINLAQELGVELLFLPPYSPNLNLIERLWKLVKKECLYSKYYKNFTLFSRAIMHFLNTMNDTHSTKLSSLLTLNFQFFTEEQIKNAA